ncbi:type VI secretion system membrane subunit TssM [Roseospira visakhapatnamensis]|uniref:Type VI secretion system protein ImpL n=1 Tax=Roseospira visakhapatnamensis TaxID=390880 RepID=A0A7W6RF96_9PROT|nr:type VI secretion system membrane subunit TssM [Roseospira visakhapatnamensis]MBB4266863.1 type VI secretion system protein ImpL [Roseospira visakhapatnamensis]
MGVLKAIGRALISLWFLTLLLAVALGLGVWFFGPLVSVAEVKPFASAFVRVAVAMGILVLWGLINLVVQSRRASAAAAGSGSGAEEAATAPGGGDDEGGAADGEDPVPPEAENELYLVRFTRDRALGILRRARFLRPWSDRLFDRLTRGHAYVVPWYLLLGPPGAGKTTLLKGAGVPLPHAGRVGRTARAGGLGADGAAVPTETVDWWLTDRAVFIDPAGHTLTQHRDPAVDAAVWRGFLDLLKGARPRQPLNGVIVTLDPLALAALGEVDRREAALGLRQRLAEMDARFGLRVPVYVVFTHLDRLAGFEAFFDTLGPEDRGQVWGHTLPADDGRGGAGVVGGVGPAFDGLLRRLNERLIERMHREPDARWRGLVMGFPAQLATLRPVVVGFLEETFAPNRFEDRALLRGFYLASATQAGPTEDRLMPRLSSLFGLDARFSAGEARTLGGRRRGYFLSALVRRVMLGEARLAGLDRGRERRQRRWEVGVIAAVALVGALLAAWMVRASLSTGHLLARMEDTADRVATQTEDMPGRQVTDARVADALAALTVLRDAPVGWTERSGRWIPLRLDVGLSRDAALEDAAVRAYRAGLETLLLPRLLRRLEGQIRAATSQPDYRFAALKVYLMLGRQGPLDAATLAQWYQLDARRLYPAAEQADLRPALPETVADLVAAPFPQVDLDDALIIRTRLDLAAHTPAQRGHALLMELPAVQALPTWRVDEAAGPLASRALVRASGHPLAAGLPGRYTYDGYHTTVKPSVGVVADAVLDDAWVMGETIGPAERPGAKTRLSDDILALLLADYGDRWDRLLADVSVMPFATVDQALDVLNALGDARSPLKLFLQAAAVETTLVPGPEGMDAGAAADVAGALPGQAGSMVQRVTSSRLAGAVAALGGGGAAAPPPPGQVINDRFADLHRLVTAPGEGSAAPIEALTEGFKAMYDQFNRAALAPDQGQALLSQMTSVDQGPTPVARMLALAGQLPTPASRLAREVAEAAQAVTSGTVSQRLNALWRAEVLPACAGTLRGRYPADPEARADMALEDFGALFGPGGTLDAFFNTNLAPFVDTTVEPWAWRAVKGASLGLAADSPRVFQRAAAIRDRLFPTAEPKPLIRFEITPVELDARAQTARLDIQGQTLVYRHGPVQSVPMLWPAETPRASLSLGPGLPDGAGRSTLVAEGPWAFQRLLDWAEVAPAEGRDDLYFAFFAVGPRQVVYALRTGGGADPFDLAPLRRFRCPDAL